MKKLSILAIVILICISVSALVFAQEDVKKYPSCKYCGMDREKFAHSRVLIEYEDGTAVPLCSIHCAAVDLAINIDKTPKMMWVGDYGTKSLVDVEKALWVIGGKQMGVMTKRAKWAFEKKQDAEKFKTENGGELANFDQAIRASYEDMYQDTKMIRERRKMKKMEHKK
jgi:nitrous oxide reductase accessory protein NosL